MKFYTAVAAIALTAPSSAAGEGNDSQPWDALSSALSSPDILTVPTIDAFVAECAGTYLSDPTMTDEAAASNELQKGSNWQLLDQPSRLCADTLTCAFKDCLFPDAILSKDMQTPGDDAVAMYTDTAAAFGRSEAHFAFPARVVQPVSVGDVVASLKFAYEHKVPVTVKTSGHHYTGASTGRGTLNINTRSLPSYAADSITECVEPDADGSIIGLSCRLALARGKSAVIRVGGGEVWDAVLQSVLNYNEDPANADGNKYMALSGAARSVSGAGGWLASGGNSAVRGQRLHGLGVDQVLQMEMVLPNGTHVRFGPDEWEDAPDFLYPKTIKVKGHCNENPAGAEDEWAWTECDVVDFNELWMAARGGGGGTWGIVTSLVYQLHPRPGHYSMKFLPLTTSDAWKTILGNETMVGAIDKVVEDFKLEFYLNPSAIGVEEDDSRACGCDWVTYPHFPLPPWGLDGSMGPSEASCMGEKAREAWAAGWRAFLSEGRGKEALLAGGLSEEQIEEMAGWAYGSDWKERAAAFVETNGPLMSVPDDTKAAIGLAGKDDLAVLNWAFTEDDPTKRSLQFSSVPGRLPDVPTPYVYSSSRYFGATTSLISTKHVLEERDTLVPLLARWNRSGQPWYVYGGAILNGHDQMTAIPRNRREGGLYVHFDLLMNGDIFETVLPIMLGDLDPSSDAFPGFVGHNHNVRHGPLKEDWTKPCPITYTLDELDELCISEQEAVWGTELLARLEKFKAEIDPDGIMTCPTGVGFKRADSGGVDATPEGEADPASSGSYFVTPSVFVLGVGIAVLF